MKKTAIIGILLLAAVLAVSLLRSRDFDEHQHERFQTALWTLKQLDAGFKQDVLRARFSLLNTYDDFDDNRRQLAPALAATDVAPAFVSVTARSEMAAASTTYRALLDRRAQIIEHFKSLNAVATNSRRYLPLAIEELIGRLGTAPADQELAAVIHQLAPAVLASVSNADAATERALAQADQLRAWAVRHPAHALAGLNSSVERHARTLVSGAARLDALTGEMLALPTADSIERLQHEYEAEVSAALGRAQRTRRLLYALGALLLALIGFTLWTQRTANRRLEQRVAERTGELASSEQRFRTLATAAPIGIFLTDAAGSNLYTNPHWESITGLSSAESLGEGWRRALHPEDAAGVNAEWARCIGEGREFNREIRFRRPNDEVRIVNSRSAVVRGADHQIVGHVGTVQDITEHKRISAELNQAQKLESVGRLAAGVAHEINTPVQFVNDSCHFLRDGLSDLQSLVGQYRQTLAAVADGSVSATAALEQSRAAEQRADIDYLLANMPGAVERSLEGLQRVTTIVRSMKEFAHPEQKEKAYADLNRAIESTLTVASNEYKYVADVHTEFGDLPQVSCFLGDLNQAVLNIVVNAAHAIGDVVKGTGQRGLITVRTTHDGDCVTIAIADTGTGIPDQIRDRIFDPFFTTKEVGKGTGQGLAIARSVVVDKHQGTLSVDTQPGRGTTFTIRLPVRFASNTEHALEALAA